MNLNNFISELKRRNVIRVATAYAIAGWLIIQVVTSVSEPLGLPDWFDTAIIVLVLIGLPITLIIAWAFELTPEGLKKSEEVEITESVSAATGKKINGIIIGTLSLLVVFLLVERIFFAESTLLENDTPEISQVSDKSIAVLPFDDFNAGGTQEYFADGLTEEILNSLAKTPDLLVASRTSSFQYKDKNIDVIKIADTLGVAHILEGSIRESSDKYRVTAQLIRASDGFHLWSDTYDRPKTDIIEIQEEIAFQIATALETAMDPEALKDMVQVGTSSVEAYQKYAEGLARYLDFDLNELSSAYKKFEEARAIDPQFASAHYRSALYWKGELDVVSMGGDLLPGTYTEKVQKFNDRIDAAIEHAGGIDRLKYRADKAAVNLEFRKAMELLDEYLNNRPNDSEAFQAYNVMATSLGEYEMGIKRMRQQRASILENEGSYAMYTAQYFWNKDEANAGEFIDQALEKFPYGDFLAYQAHRVLIWRGEYEKASGLLDKIEGFKIPIENKTVSLMRQACAEGRIEDAKIHFNEILSNEVNSGLWIAYMMMGMDDEANEITDAYYERGELYSLASFLYYRYFDYTRYPDLERLLEDHKRGPVEQIPFRCGR